MMSRVTRIIALALMLLVTGCASTNPKDPFEKFNRAMFEFNDAVDQAAVKPAAEVYRNVLPSFVQTGIYNFFGNLGDVATAMNNLLQGKLADGMSDVMRVAVNTTFGLGGLLDIGSEAGLVKHKEDFGQTLGYWGIASGPYIVLPILGSSTLRDVGALPVDWETDPWRYVSPVHTRNTGSVLRILDLRASVLDASNLIEEAALDRYQFVRDAYMQRRESKVNDGELSKSVYEEEGTSTSGTPAAPATSGQSDQQTPSNEPVQQGRNDTSAPSMASVEKQ